MYLYTIHIPIHTSFINLSSYHPPTYIFTYPHTTHIRFKKPVIHLNTRLSTHSHPCIYSLTSIHLFTHIHPFIHSHPSIYLFTSTHTHPSIHPHPSIYPLIIHRFPGQPLPFLPINFKLNWGETSVPWIWAVHETPLVTRNMIGCWTETDSFIGQ